MNKGFSLSLSCSALILTACGPKIDKSEHAPVTFASAMIQLRDGMRILSAEQEVTAGKQRKIGLAVTQMEATFEVGTDKHNQLTVSGALTPGEIAAELGEVKAGWEAKEAVKRGNKVVVTFKNTHMDKDGKPYPTIELIDELAKRGYRIDGTPIVKDKGSAGNTQNGAGEKKEDQAGKEGGATQVVIVDGAGRYDVFNKFRTQGLSDKQIQGVLDEAIKKLETMKVDPAE